MTKYLPISDFNWLKNEEIEKIDWSTLSDKNDRGFILEVDLEYPVYLHDYHSDYPLAPIKRKIDTTELSPYQKKLVADLESNGIKRVATEKLILDLNNKYNYVLHSSNLKLYLELGLKLMKIHKVLSFKQSQWLKPYIIFNTKLRENAKDRFEQDLIKLFNNSIYGKCCENIRQHVDIKLVMNEKQAKTYLKRPLFEEFRIIDENKALIKMRKTSITLNKPIIVGYCILELSKCLMYEYHYKVFKKIYGDHLYLQYTDTDAFIYEIHTSNVYNDFKLYFKEILDLSNYDTAHELFSEENKKKLGHMKDETEGKIIEEYIGLKPKLYSLKYFSGKTESKCKGLQRNVLKKFIKHEYYKNVLEKNNIIISETRRIKNENFNLTTIKMKKISHSPFDDKRYILDNMIETVPFGYKGKKFKI
jgi:hypothetical protein